MDLQRTNPDQPNSRQPNSDVSDTTERVDHADVAVVDDHVLLAQSVVLTLRSQGMTATAFITGTPIWLTDWRPDTSWS